MIFGILKNKIAYAIMPIGKNDVSAPCGHTKSPGAATPGLFYSFFGEVA